MRQIQEVELVDAWNQYLGCVERGFYSIPQGKIKSLLRRWEHTRLEWLIRRVSLLSIWPPYRKHYDAWIEICDRFIVALEDALEP